MYEQNLFRVIEPIKKTTITRMNRGKKWKYGYNKEHDIVVISKTGKIGEIYEIQGLRIGLPLEPVRVYMHEKKKWVKLEQPKELTRLKSIFDWRGYPEESKEQWFDYIPYLLSLARVAKLTVSADDINEKPDLLFFK